MATTILTQTTRFVNDSAGLEKTLRLLQSLVQIIASYSLSTASAQPWLIARKQFALGRRYLRIVKFVDAFGLSYSCFMGDEANEGEGMRKGRVVRMLEVGKWGFLGMYLGLESLTILDTMGVYSTTWAEWVFVEAMKFWFYSLVLSVLISVVGLWGLYTTPFSMKKNGKKEMKEKEKEEVEEERREMKREWRQKRGKIVKKLVVDCCDLVIPGTVTGWLTVSSRSVGYCSVISTVLAGGDVWARVQGQTL